MHWHPVWTNLRQSSIDTVKTDTCKHAWYTDDNWLHLISILEQSGGHTSPKDAVLSQWSNPKKVAPHNSCMRRDCIVLVLLVVAETTQVRILVTATLLSVIAYEFEFLQCDVWIKLFLYLKKSIASYKMCADSEKSCLCDQVGYVIK